MSILNKISSLFDFKAREEEKKRRKDAAVQTLRDAFNARCSHFKVLLSANKRALEIMADIEAHLAGEAPFDMSYIRRQTTQVSINIYRMIESLNSLAGDAYLELYNSFSSISSNLSKIIEAKSKKEPTKNAPLVLPMTQVGVHLLSEVGGKMANLGEIGQKLAFKIPHGFVVTSTGYRDFMREGGLQEEINRIIQSSNAKELDEMLTLSATIQKLIKEATLPRVLELALDHALEELLKHYPGAKLAVRSSAIDEDSGEASFAGQYASELNVHPKDLVAKFKDVIASKYSTQAMIYRINHGLLDEDVPMCVGCIVMIEAIAGGVVYSRDPLHPNTGNVVINSVFGLPKSVVDGDMSPDVFSVKRNDSDAGAALNFENIVERDIAVKKYKLLCDEDGIETYHLDAVEAIAPSLSDEKILEVSNLALACEKFYGEAQDVEWALDPDNTLVVLQSRPLPKAKEEQGDDVFKPELPVIIEGGITASPGIAVGPVYVVRLEADMVDFPDKGVLVTTHAHSRWAPLLSKASAIITETGGTAGHLASVAREYGVPAIFNLKGALAGLGSFEAKTVTVDAYETKIYAGAPSVLPEPRKMVSSLSDSPVYKTLEEVSKLIVPLHLISPSAPNFSPEFCLTLHDITRFCHEKAITEFFNPNSTDSLRAGKQLVAEHKLQYWVINLDNGYYAPVATPTVDISNIASLPMLALWAGMAAVRWAGPPATTSKGFMALMAESAANPDLELTRQGGNMGGRNYFLVSREYCTLQASFGYHFCTVEAQSGAVAVENYLNFHFKGGASNLAKRTARATILAEILTDFGFMVDIRQDALFARIEAVDSQTLLNALVWVGHIIIHSRQADVGLGSEAGILHFKENLESGLKGLPPFVMPEQQH